MGAASSQGVFARCPGCSAASDARLQQLAIFQLGQVWHERRADENVYLGSCKDGFLLAVHHFGGLPHGCPWYLVVRPCVQDGWDEGLCDNDPASGAGAQGGDLDSPEMVWRGADRLVLEHGHSRKDIHGYPRCGCDGSSVC